MDRRMLWMAGVGAALAGPYLAMDGNLPSWLAAQRNDLFGRTTASATDDPWAAYTSAAWAQPDASVSASQTPITPLDEILRFDVTPSYVVSRWPKVITVVSEQNLSGMRVPVITGYQPHDIVGSLTYYFDHQQRVRRIGIEGYTGDESPIVGIASERFGLRSEPRLGAGLYVYRWNAQALSVLHVDFAPIVSSELPQLRRRVMLEVNAPLPGCQLSTEMQTIVNPIGL